jgi:hypothetical protein
LIALPTGSIFTTRIFLYLTMSEFVTAEIELIKPIKIKTSQNIHIRALQSLFFKCIQ